ncbi:MAG: ABC transporter substrate-binding protein, partial [Desertifilum sp. SIO1I2]|nr:ABC transporter substrate-binding protein [Desertifilum sp. SIO1I2]
KSCLRWIVPLVLLMLTACQERTRDSQTPSAAAECQQIQHSLGETRVCQPPQRIVVLAPSLLELLLVLDLQPVGYADLVKFQSDTLDNPREQIPLLGDRITQPIRYVGTSTDPSLEAIVQLKPDLILATLEMNQQEYALLSQIAPTLILPYGAGNDWQENLQKIAQLTDRSELAQNAIAQHQQRVAQVRQNLAPEIQNRSRILVLVGNQLDRGLRVEGNTNSCGSLLENIGFELVLPSNSPTGSPNLSLEKLPQLPADSVLLLGYDFSRNTPQTQDFERSQLQQIQQDWQNNAIAQSLKASQDNRVYFGSAYSCLAYPGPLGAEVYLQEIEEQILSP